MRKRRSKPSSLVKAEREHSEFLKKMGVDPETLKKNRRIRKDKKKPVSKSSTHTEQDDITSIAGVAAKKPEQVYTGEREYLGAFTMHKSNMVPVFGDRKEDAKDIAKMRRG